jgi:hypothetical protein
MSRRPFAGLDFGRIARDVADDPTAQTLADELFMNPLG